MRAIAFSCLMLCYMVQAAWMQMENGNIWYGKYPEDVKAVPALRLFANTEDFAGETIEFYGLLRIVEGDVLVTYSREKVSQLDLPSYLPITLEFMPSSEVLNEISGYWLKIVGKVVPRKGFSITRSEWEISGQYALVVDPDYIRQRGDSRGNKSGS